MGKSSNPTFAGDKEFEKIHLKEKFSYGLGDVACNVVYALTTSLLIYFYTNVVGISAAMIGTIMLFSRFFDGISDVLIGHLVDRTHSKHGKSRAWILWMRRTVPISSISPVNITISLQAGNLRPSACRSRPSAEAPAPSCQIPDLRPDFLRLHRR